MKMWLKPWLKTLFVVFCIWAIAYVAIVIIAAGSGGEEFDECAAKNMKRSVNARKEVTCVPR